MVLFDRSRSIFCLPGTWQMFSLYFCQHISRVRRCSRVSIEEKILAAADVPYLVQRPAVIRIFSSDYQHQDGTTCLSASSSSASPDPTWWYHGMCTNLSSCSNCFVCYKLELLLILLTATGREKRRKIVGLSVSVMMIWWYKMEITMYK